MSETQPNWVQADDEDMRELAEREEQEGEPPGPMIPGIRIKGVLARDLPAFADELHRQGGARRVYNPGWGFIQAQAEEQAQKQRAAEAQEERKALLAAVALELARQGINPDVTAPYTPVIVAAAPEGGKGLGTMAVALETCPTCGKWMIHPRHSNADLYDHNAPADQIHRAGWVLRSDATVNKHTICQDCKLGGKAIVVCSLCNQSRPTTEIEDVIGSIERSYLCTHCYQTMPAAAWDRKKGELEREHQWEDDEDWH